MAGTIKKPDANPVVALLLTLILFLGHLLINGQQRKWLMNIVVYVIGCICLVIPGMIIGILSLIEAYQTAERLQKGEEIGENEYTNPLLFKIVSLIDKEATLKPGAA